MPHARTSSPGARMLGADQLPAGGPPRGRGTWHIRGRRPGVRGDGDGSTRLVGRAGPVVTANLRWLVGYRHLPPHLPEVAGVLGVVFAMPTPLLAHGPAAGEPLSR